MSGKDLTQYLKPPVSEQPKDEMDFLDSLDFDSLESTLESKRSGGGEVLEASNVCEGGGCTI